MKKIIAFLAAIAAIAPTAQAFEYTEEYFHTANEELIVKTTSSQLSVKRGNKQIWFVPEFYAYSPGAYTERVYPYFNADKTEITFKSEKKDPTLFIFDCLKTTVRHTYSGEYLIGGDMSEVKDNMCSRHFGKDWKWAAERAEREEYEDKEYSLKLKYSSIGYMDIQWDVRDFRYDAEKDVVTVPWRARNDGSSDRYTVDDSWAGKTFVKESTYGRFLGTPSGTYTIDCRDNWKGRLVRSTSKPYKVEDPHTREVKLEGLHRFTQNRICKFKTEYRPL